MDQVNNNITNDRNKFDINKFNKVFDEVKEENKSIYKKNDDDRLRVLNQDIVDKPLYDTTISDIFIGIKSTWFYILDDLLQQKFTLNTFSKDNRLFYIGITLLFFGVIIYFFNFFNEGTPNEVPMNTNPHEKIIEKHYIYQNTQSQPNVVNQS